MVIFYEMRPNVDDKAREVGRMGIKDGHLWAQGDAKIMKIAQRPLDFTFGGSVDPRTEPDKFLDALFDRFHGTFFWVEQAPDDSSLPEPNSKGVSESKELVLFFGVAGDGIHIYRTVSRDGKWQYHAETASMDLDENDDELWRTSREQPVAELERALQDFPEWPICFPATVHPEYGQMIWHMYRAAKDRLSEEWVSHWTAEKEENWRLACRVDGISGSDSEHDDVKPPT
jgi:hypothetical protein